MADQSHPRPEIRVQAVVGGWPHPWPNVAEIAGVLPPDRWTLVGGLMTQLHTVNHGLGVVRPTNDVDIRSTCSPPTTRADCQRMSGRDMVASADGTRALKRTINAVLDIRPDIPTVISVPRPIAAVILKAAAYNADSRDRDRHLYDATALLACIEDPFAEAEGLGGSDRSRIRTLTQRLPDGHPAWLTLARPARTNAQTALRILASA